jgi:hypothetical protein
MVSGLLYILARTVRTWWQNEAGTGDDGCRVSVTARLPRHPLANEFCPVCEIFCAPPGSQLKRHIGGGSVSYLYHLEFLPPHVVCVFVCLRHLTVYCLAKLTHHHTDVEPVEL